jgi:transposase InsO family protein
LNYKELEIKEYVASIGIACATFFNWQNKKKNNELEDKSSKPDESPKATSDDDLIAALKVIIKYPEWGGEKVSQYLTREEICYLSPSTINRIKNNLDEYLDTNKVNCIQRYEFINPNDCWALDFTEFNWGDKTLYLCFILDDHSRYILDWSITASPTFEFVKNLLSKAFKQYGTPKAVKSDNGPQFRKQFGEFLDAWLIKHHSSPVYSPTYNGKIERKNQDLKQIIEQIDEQNTCLEELFTIISNSIYEHNYVRPHQSLDGVTPFQSYNGFADEVKAKMETFKKQELERKGFKSKKKVILPNQEEKPKTKGLIVPVHLINDPDTCVGFVKQLIEI